MVGQWTNSYLRFVVAAESHWVKAMDELQL